MSEVELHLKIMKWISSIYLFILMVFSSEVITRRYNHRLKNILKNYDIVQFLLLQKFCTMVNTSIYLSMINNTQTIL